MGHLRTDSFIGDAGPAQRRFAQARWSALGTGSGHEIEGSAVVLVVGALITVAGGTLMYVGRGTGKGLVICGLFLGIVAQAAEILAYRLTGIDLVSPFTGMATLLLFYLVVAMSRPALADDNAKREESRPAIS